MFPDEIDRLFQILETLELIIESKILFRGKVGKFGSCQHQKTINNVKTNTTNYKRNTQNNIQIIEKIINHPKYKNQHNSKLININK